MAKGLFGHVGVESQQPNFVKVQLQGTRFAQFRDIFKQKFGILIRLNILTLLFSIPLAVVLFIFFVVRTNMRATLPFNGNIGIGLPIVDNVMESYRAWSFAIELQQNLILIPLIVFAFAGLAGIFNATKRLAWGEDIRVLSAFFGGIKQHLVKFMLIGFVMSLPIFLLMFNISVVQNTDSHSVLAIFGIIFSSILLLWTAGAAIFMTTQATLYKVSFFRMLKNSYLLSLGMIFGNIFVLIVSILPFFLLLFLGSMFNFLMMFALLGILLLGFGFVALIFTVYSHFVYDRVINDKIGQKDKQVHTTDKQAERAERELRKKKVVRFDNPKKKKSLDLKSNITELSRTFNRADLDKLDKEKIAALQESEEKEEQQE